jgi:hypothetical protein
MQLNQAEQRDQTHTMEPRRDEPIVSSDTKWLFRKKWSFDWDITIRQIWRKLFKKGD